MSLEAAQDRENTTRADNLADSPLLFSLDTAVDLAGSIRSERLLVYEQKLVIVGGDGLRERQREWWLPDFEGFRMEPAVGSCFLQGQVEGKWVDVLRRPGVIDRQLTDLVAHLNACCRSTPWTDCPETPGSGRAPTQSRWFSERTTSGATPQRWHTARRLLAFMRPFRGSVVLLLTLSFGAVAIDVAPPMLQRVLVDNVLQAETPRNGMGQLLMLLLAIVAGLLLIRFASALVAIWKGRISSQVGTTLTANLRDELVKKLNELPLAFHDRNQVGMLMSRVAYDTETLHTLVYHMTGGFLLQSFQLVGIGIMLFYLNPMLALITMLPMPLIIAGSWYFTKYLNPRYQHYWEAVGKQASALTGMLSGIRVVKAFVQEDREIQRFCESSHRLRDSRQTVDFSTATFTALMGLLFALGGLAVWYVGGRAVLFGEMTLGSLMAFLAYLAMFYTPLTTIAESTTWFSNFFTTSRRIFELLDTPTEIVEPESAASLKDAQGRVEFQNVSFGYDKHRPVLKDISFTIQPGEMIGVVGRSGSGKSTLVSLIARLYEADAGQILVDGIDVRQIGSHELRRRIGMVPQEPFLFRGTVAENIAYGKSHAAPEEILRAGQYADAHNFILRMPFAYETRLGEGGSGLSGGERQRLSIARALLFDPAILILDEATASIDAESERAICDAIRRFSRKRTTIAIAHRLSTLKDADRLIVFDQGRLIEQGTHDELLGQEGLYSTLVSIQGNLRDGRRRVESFLGNPNPSNGKCVAIELGGDGEMLESFAHDDYGSSVRPRLSGNHDKAEEGDLHWLNPASVVIEGGGHHGGLRVIVDRHSYEDVYAVHAFPASHPRKFISLRRRDSLGHEVEVGMVLSLDQWPRGAQEAMLWSLGRRYLLRQIREIRQIHTSGPSLSLSVVTDSGPSRIHLEKPGEEVQPFGSHGLLLVDAHGCYYVLPDRGALPKRQRRLLTLYFGD
jgi:ATP-binding cassette subfamily B protein